MMDGRIDAHRDREVRSALEPLGQLAEKAGAAVLGLVHLGKGMGTDPVNLILGSRAFSAVARVALVAARDPDDEKTNVLSVEKSNLGRIDVAGLTYRIDGAEIATDEGMAGAGLLVWTGETDRRVRDIMADLDGERTDRADASNWLHNLLADGPVKANDVYQAADAAGLSKDKAKRAKKRIHALAAKAGMDGPWYWALAEHEGDLDDLAEGSTKNANSAGHESLLSTHPSLLPSRADPTEEETTVKLSTTPPIDRLLRRKPEPRAKQCRICLQVTDDLREGSCRDRAACEARQPAFPDLDGQDQDGAQ